jgi:hypothetical protein
MGRLVVIGDPLVHGPQQIRATLSGVDKQTGIGTTPRPFV